MKHPTDMGTNRTGIGMSPLASKATIEGARESVPDPDIDLTAMESIRTFYSDSADPVGTMPPPASLKGVAKSATEMLKGNMPTVFLDLLGERLAFERTGTRLYEALLVKFDAAHVHPGGPTREELVEHHNDELQHFGLLMECIEQLGADPTAVTPSADVSGVASLGAMQVLTDPRSTLTECLHVIHMLELMDNDSWQMLSELADQLGHEDMAQRFRQAMIEEATHLMRVRSWVKASIQGQAGVAAASSTENVQHH